MQAKGYSFLRFLVYAPLIAFFYFSFSAEAQATAPNEWTWVGGLSTGAKDPVTGTQGSFAPGNIPGARYQSVTWTDKNGNLWLFGGTGCTSCAAGYDLELNDLWELNPSANEWAWIGGSTAGGKGGVYGTTGTPSAQNTPGGREGASGWTDSKGNLWLFGGYGLDANSNFVILNDLWQFDPSAGTWTWMSGSSTVTECFNDGSGNSIGAIDCAAPATYGTLGTAAPGNTPGSRQGAITWTDSNGNLWMFGGRSFDVPNATQYYFNELWEYNTSSHQWAWMGGSSTRDGSSCGWNVNIWYYSCGEPGVYGTIGTPASGNIPGGRSDAISWTDSSGNLWLFSGIGFDVNGHIGDNQDLWKFSPTSGQWAWIGGASAQVPCSSTYINGGCSGPAVYGTLGVAAVGNLPGGRDHAVGWSDRDGNFWFYGGGIELVPNNINNGNAGLNDLWEFSRTANQWTWMGGSVASFCSVYCVANQAAVYGALGVPAPGDQPGPRFAPAGWADREGNFWLFGGELPPTEGRSLFENDLWEYQPSPGEALPTAATPAFSPPGGSYGSAQNVTIEDTTNGALIFYTTDGTTPTINSVAAFPSTPSQGKGISIPHSETLKVIAIAPGCLPSAVASAVYTLPPQAAPPTFSVPTGTYTSFQTVILSDAAPHASIYYTLNGTTPTTSSMVYSGPISITNAYTPIQAVAIADGYTLSNVASAAYTLNLPYTAAPTFSVIYGTYNTPQTLTLTDATPGATIYYQIDSTYPSTSSPVYSGPITISSTETIYAMATAPNRFPSGSLGGQYVIDPSAPQTATPVFSVPTGTYSTVQTVTISDATPQAFVYYTTDGSSPTRFSAIYTYPITVASSEKLQAVAIANYDTASGLASASYTLNLPPPSFSIAGSNIQIVAGATTGNTSAITITPVSGFTGIVNLSCAITPTAASDPATCVIPSSVNIPDTRAEGVMLIVKTTAASIAHNPASDRFDRMASATALACVVLLGFRIRRPKWRAAIGMVVLLSCVAAGPFGCGGGGSSSGSGSAGGGTGGGSGGQVIPGTTPGTYNVTVTGTSGATTQTGTISLTLQ